MSTEVADLFPPEQVYVDAIEEAIRVTNGRPFSIDAVTRALGHDIDRDRDKTGIALRAIASRGYLRELPTTIDQGMSYPFAYKGWTEQGEKLVRVRRGEVGGAVTPIFSVDQVRVVEKIYKLWVDQGHWPNWQQVDKAVDVDLNLDFAETAKEMPVGVMSGGIPGHLEVEVQLRIYALVHLASARSDLERFVAAIRYAASREKSFDPDPNSPNPLKIVAAEFAKTLQIDESHELSRVRELLTVEQVAGVSGEPPPGNKWTASIDRSIRRFRNVGSVDQYLVIIGAPPQSPVARALNNLSDAWKAYDSRFKTTQPLVRNPRAVDFSGASDSYIPRARGNAGPSEKMADGLGIETNRSWIERIVRDPVAQVVSSVLLAVMGGLGWLANPVLGAGLLVVAAAVVVRYLWWRKRN